jgi:hypothetical protein
MEPSCPRRHALGPVDADYGYVAEASPAAGGGEAKALARNAAATQSKFG